MSRRTTKLLKATLSTLHYTGAARLIAPFTRGNGVIFMMHHVLPDRPDSFEPNRILKVTPEFLDSTIRQVIDSGFDVVSLDEAHRRMSANPTPSKPFACFTFDDGYRDNKVHAYPVFKRYGLPFAIYVATDYADGAGDLWWLLLEQIVRAAPKVVVQMEGALRTFQTRTVAEKYSAFHQIYWWLRRIPEDRARQVVRDLAGCMSIDPRELCRDLVMNWDELRELARDPLVTIAAHTCQHLALGRLDEAHARREMTDSIARIEHELGRPCRHFSYPYGDARSAGPREFRVAAELGMLTAVTTRKGVVGNPAARCLTGLPRVSLNGDYQDPRYVKVLLSGAPFACLDWFRRLAPITTT